MGEHVSETTTNQFATCALTPTGEADCWSMSGPNQGQISYAWNGGVSGILLPTCSYPSSYPNNCA